MLDRSHFPGWLSALGGKPPAVHAGMLPPPSHTTSATMPPGSIDRCTALLANFLTAAETAMHANGRLKEPLIKLLGGHARGSLAFDLYSDWTRMGRPGMAGKLAQKLKTLRAAVEDVVTLGMPKAILDALEATQGDRPPVVMVVPASGDSMDTQRGSKPRGWTTARLGYLVALVVYLLVHLGIRYYHGQSVSTLQAVGTAILTLCAVVLVTLRVRAGRRGIA